MYIYIQETGDIQYSKDHPSSDDLKAVEDGLVDIIRVDGGSIPLMYYDADWNEVECID